MITLSIVIPVYQGSKTIGKLTKNLISTLKNYSPEIILVNDGSRDDSHKICLGLCKKYPRQIKYLNLSRNFGEHNAVMAGLNFVTGDYAVIIDDDFQNPPTEIEKLVKKAIQDKLDVVYSYYAKKEHSFFRNLGSSFNNLIATILLNKPRSLYLSSFKCMNKFIIHEVIKYTGPFPYIDGLILRNTEKIGKTLVRHSSRKVGKSSYTFRKLIKLWLNMFINFSIFPLRLSTLLGILFSVLGLVLTIFFVIDKILRPQVPWGITTILAALFTYLGVQLLILGLIGEYLGKLFMTSNQSPQYVIRHFYKKGKEKTNQRTS